MHMPNDFLTIALNEAKKRRGFTAPNPAVGAAIVKDGKLLATGTHWASGSPHAEVDALNQLGGKAQGASLYVTLEPCCHYGKTPPCTELIIERGVANVFYGFDDPNPEVSGQGVKQLQQAGVSCQKINFDEIDDFYRSYAYWQKYQRPWVTIKLALSADGKIAGPNSVPVAITGPDCKRYTHQWRLQSDAILTTVKTIICDDPKLNVRLDDKTIAKPIYILDRLGELPKEAGLWQSAAEIIVFHSSLADSSRIQELTKLGARCIEVEADSQGLDLNHVLAHMGQSGIHDLWVEAGGRCFQSFFEQRLFNRAFLYVAPKKLGEQAKAAFSHSFNVKDYEGDIQWFAKGDDLVCEFVSTR